MSYLTFAAAVLLVAANAYSQNYKEGEVIVKLRGKSQSLASHAFLGSAIAEKGLSLKGKFSRLNMLHFQTKPGQKVEEAIAELMQDPTVEYAEPNYYLNKFVDDELSKVRYMHADLPSLAPSGSSVPRMTSANLGQDEAIMRLSPVSDNDYVPVVAIIDTGVDIYHDVFQQSGAIWTNPYEIPGNGIDDDQNGYVDDVNGWNFYGNNPNPVDDDGHGTHVAGIVLGLDGVGLDIFADEVEQARIRIMPLKFLGPGGAGTTSDAIEAIHYAISNGADILNNSWGGPDYSRALHDAVVASYQRGLTFIAAAGNSGDNNDQLPMYPASLSVPQVVSVAAVNDWDDLASFSNYGQESVDIGSPGVAILSTFPGSTFGYSSGTSMAAPFVAGLAALMKIENPDLTGYEIKSLIFEGAEPIGTLQPSLSTSSRINLRGSSDARRISGGADLPSYDASAHEPQARRAPASVQQMEVAPGGCGMAAVLKNFRGGGGPTSRPPFFGLLVVLVLVPLVLMRVYNSVLSPASRRRHQRYHLNTAVTMNIGGREMIGEIGTISLGGVSLNTDAMLEHGGVVRMQIEGPDGKGSIDVEGQIVWSDTGKSYGVQFAESEDGIRDTIRTWTSGLVKSS